MPSAHDRSGPVDLSQLIDAGVTVAPQNTQTTSSSSGSAPSEAEAPGTSDVIAPEEGADREFWGNALDDEARSSLRSRVRMLVAVGVGIAAMIAVIVVLFREGAGSDPRSANTTPAVSASAETVPGQLESLPPLPTVTSDRDSSPTPKRRLTTRSPTIRTPSVRPTRSSAAVTRRPSARATPGSPARVVPDLTSGPTEQPPPPVVESPLGPTEPPPVPTTS